MTPHKRVTRQPGRGGGWAGLGAGAESCSQVFGRAVGSRGQAQSPPSLPTGLLHGRDESLTEQLWGFRGQGQPPLPALSIWAHLQPGATLGFSAALRAACGSSAESRVLCPGHLGVQWVLQGGARLPNDIFIPQ